MNLVLVLNNRSNALLSLPTMIISNRITAERADRRARDGDAVREGQNIITASSGVQAC